MPFPRTLATQAERLDNDTVEVEGDDSDSDSDSDDTDDKNDDDDAAEAAPVDSHTQVAQAMFAAYASEGGGGGRRGRGGGGGGGEAKKEGGGGGNAWITIGTLREAMKGSTNDVRKVTSVFEDFDSEDRGRMKQTDFTKMIEFLRENDPKLVGRLEAPCLKEVAADTATWARREGGRHRASTASRRGAVKVELNDAEQEQVDDLFEALDDNGDGSLEASELAFLFEDHAGHEEGEINNLHEVFEAFEDKDGMLDEDDFSNLIRFLKLEQPNLLQVRVLLISLQL